MSFLTTSGWVTFLLVFSILAKSLWFYYYFSLYAFNKQKYNTYYGKVALVCPCYNEDEKHLKDTIESVKRVQGLSEIVFINDGSTKTDVIGTLNNNNDGSYNVIDLKQNVGKRKAQEAGVNSLSDDVDVIVYIDSDTVLQENTILELLKPLTDPEVAGVTAQILVRNKDENIITKSSAAMYWSASNIWREAPSKLGFVQVTNGQLSCYRARYIKEMMAEYVNQMFMGVNCTMSDDRWITHHLQTDYKKKVVYQKSSIAYTYVPNTLKGSFKMFLRWKMGSLRESLLILKRGFSKPLLTLDIWWNHSVAILQMIVRVGILIGALFYPMILLWYMFIMTIISLLFALEMVFENIKEIPYRIIYTWLNETYYWLVLPLAIIKIKQQGKWGTR